MIGVLLLSTCIAFVSGRPSESISLQNVVTVPPNCPIGQVWVNGECRDVWKNLKATVQGLSNVIIAPPNCPPGQDFFNGKCREVWIKTQIQNNMLRGSNNIKPSDTLTVPISCLKGQLWVNGACREVWRNNYGIPMNVITVPPNCPPGQVFINGACREVWIRISPSVEKGVISVPEQCPIGYKPDALGVCREIFTK